MLRKYDAPFRILAMVSVRAILLWLMMLAVPFQGYAAAAMAFCAPEPSQSAELAVGMPHDHSPPAQSTGHHVGGDNGADHHVAQGVQDNPSNAPHKCGTCAACHSIGLMPTLDTPEGHDLPQADLAEPLHAMATVSPSVPHKPPRA